MLTANDGTLDLILRQARTHSVWLDKPVDDALLRQVYDLAKMGPTSANMCPMRIIFVRSKEAKEELKPALDAGNVAKTMSAPVTAIIGMDVRFYDLAGLPLALPARTSTRSTPRASRTRRTSIALSRKPAGL